ncbi:hypothetical protein [Actinacidiphila alni]|uniref:hypothetical protein n=1 Tax=Actinacidiphila alni TaxID=380248 RepID=UPI003451EA35
MNYCHTCRRHLNGAFSCPGCGALVDRSAMPDEAITAELPPVVDGPVPGGPDDGTAAAPAGGDAEQPGPATGSLVDDLLRDSGLGPEAGPAPDPATGPATAPVTGDEPAAYDDGHGEGQRPDHDDEFGHGAAGADADGDPRRDTALTDSLLGGGSGGFGGGDGGGFGEGDAYHAEADPGRSARRRRARHQRAAILGIGAVAVVGSLTMFGVAALSGGTPDPATDPGPSVGAVSPAPDPGLPSPGRTSPGARGGSGGHSAGTSTSPSGSGTPSGSPSASASHTKDTATAPASGTGQPTHTASKPPVTTTAAPPTTTKPPTTAPGTPSPTCTKVLWWCQ